MIRRSIWEDTYYEYDGDRLSYYITDDSGKKIFAGKAYRMPNEDKVKININSICKNYLSNDLRPVLDAYNEGVTSAAEMDEACRIFYLHDNDEVVLEEYEFLYDWSYDFRFRGQSAILSKPINGRAVSTMFQPFTDISSETVTNYLFGDTGLYTTIDSCNAEYAIYYLNSYGGWDAFLFEGKATKSDNIKQFTTEKAFNNNTLDYEIARYTSEINTSYTLSSGWLTDEQAANFAKNLVGSNHVYMQNVKTGDFFPAIITDTKVQYQTMKNNGGKMALYQLNIKESQNKLRQ